MVRWWLELEGVLVLVVPISSCSFALGTIGQANTTVDDDGQLAWGFVCSMLLVIVALNWYLSFTGRGELKSRQSSSQARVHSVYSSVLEQAPASTTLLRGQTDAPRWTLSAVPSLQVFLLLPSEHFLVTIQNCTKGNWWRVANLNSRREGKHQKAAHRQLKWMMLLHTFPPSFLYPLLLSGESASLYALPRHVSAHCSLDIIRIDRTAWCWTQYSLFSVFLILLFTSIPKSVTGSWPRLSLGSGATLAAAVLPLDRWSTLGSIDCSSQPSKADKCGQFALCLLTRHSAANWCMQHRLPPRCTLFLLGLWNWCCSTECRLLNRLTHYLVIFCSMSPAWAHFSGTCHPLPLHEHPQSVQL